MSTSTSTKTFTSREGNTLKTVTETTVTKPDGSKTVTRQEKTETVSGGGAGGASSSRSKSGSSYPVSGGGGSASAGAGPTDTPIKDLRDQALKAHNERRKKHGASPLKLSDDLNKYAQKWAEHLVSTGTFAHSDCKLNGDTLGENIANKWSSQPTDYTGEEATEAWYSEISMHDFKTEKNRGTGHFTQVVWKESTELGIGRAKSKDGKVIVVGSYRPAGNLIGSYIKNVQPPK